MTGQTITRPAHGLDHIGAVGRCETFAQSLHMHVDRPLLDEDVVAPHAVEQLRAAVYPLGMRHEEVQ